MSLELELRARRDGVKFIALATLAGFLLAVPVSADAQTFIRGDGNEDTLINIADPIFGLNQIFSGGTPPLAPDAMDANDNGVVEVSDVVYVLRLIFAAGPNPPAPFPTAGLDTTPPQFPPAPTGAIEFAMNSVFACPGTPVRVTIDLTSSVTVEALSLRVIFDPAQLVFTSVDSSDLEALYGDIPAFFDCVSYAPGEITIGALFSLINPTGLGLSAQTLEPIVDIVFDVAPAVPLGTVIPVKFEDAPLATTPGYNLASVLGEVERASLTEGSVTADCNQIEFRRGDTNEDGATSISDAVFLIAYLFLSGAQSTCLITGDVNGDSSIDVGDAIYLLNALFAGGAAIPAPFPDCGTDSTGSGIACPSYPANCP